MSMEASPAESSPGFSRKLVDAQASQPHVMGLTFIAFAFYKYGGLLDEAKQRVHAQGCRALQPFDDDWTPCTVFGVPIASPCSLAAAEDALRAHGLSYLADRWEVFQDGAWITVTLVEARPEEVTVQYADYGHPNLFNTRITLTAPTPDQLRRQ